MIDREAEIRRLFPLVKRIARRVALVARGAELDDLIGDGSVGLIRAVDSFDPGYGLTLDQYARRIIAGAMLNGIRRLDPVSERVRRTIRIAERERFALATERGSVPTVNEMERRIRGYRRARTEAYRGTALSLDAPLPSSESLDATADGDPQRIIVRDSERRRIHGAIRSLPPRQRKLIVEHYFAHRSLRSLSSEMAVSPQRVSQLHLLAIDRLRHTLGTPAP
jgi:RNA polymerase sigma factor for flagellar operon FliA